MIMMSQTDERKILFIVCAMMAAGLIGAFTIQFAFNVPPCTLCTYQRFLYAAAGFAAMMGTMLKRRKVVLYLVFIILLMQLALGIFHVGIEQGWWRYEAACTTPLAKDMSFSEYMDKVNGANLASCDQPFIHFLGLSLAGWTTLYSLAVVSYIGTSRI